MDVYFNMNPQTDGEKPMKELWVNRDFSWNAEEGFVPAIYVGEEGIIVELCLRVSPERIRTFQEKWKTSDDDWTDEQMERIERELPFARHFEAELEADGERLVNSHCSGEAWNPLRGPKEALEVQRPGEYSAEQLADYYGCDKNFGWYFEKAAFRWKNAKESAQASGGECRRAGMALPTHFKLTLRAKKQPWTGTHFVTEEGCNEHVEEIKNPMTGERYRLTVHECSAEVLDERLFEFPGKEKLLHPRCCQTLLWSIEPELSPELFSVQDCAHGDQPRKKQIVKTPQGEREEILTVGSYAVHALAARRKGDQRHVSCSALHHEPVREVEWRTVFQIKEDIADVILEWDGECPDRGNRPELS